MLEILNIRPLRGPNFYSARPAVIMRLDLHELEERPTNVLPGFVDGLMRYIPTLIEHRCSEGVQGGFLSRMRDGTWLGHVVEHVALELQCLVGIEVGFGKTRSTEAPGVYNVVYSYRDEDVGLEAGYFAVDLCQALVDQKPFDFDARLKKLHQTRENNMLGPSTRSIVEEAERRGIPFLRLNEYNLVQLGYGAFQKRIQATVTSTTSHIGVEIAGNKELTKKLLDDAGIPVPRGFLLRAEEEVHRAADRVGRPVVVKPKDGNHGRGVTVDVETDEGLRKAFRIAKEISRDVIVERYVRGNDYRFLVVNYQLVAAAQRVPARVEGDDVHTIQQLIDMQNADPRRGYGHEKVLTLIEVDEITRWLLEYYGKSLDTVLPAGEIFNLKTTANLSTGGSAIDCTDRVHSANRLLAERVARVVGLDVCGIDIVAPEVTTPLTENGGAVIEVNAAPGFRMHVAPSEGTPRNVGAAVVDMMFPPGTRSRVPIVAVTGTNGKTTTARLVAHLFRLAGYRVGLTTTDGIYIQNQMILAGDMSGPQSARLVLRDPTVDFAVFETARGGILREGLAWRDIECGIVTNVSEDHLGLRGINTIEDLAFTKGLVVREVKKSGYAVLNAEDEHVAAMREVVHSKVAFFALRADNERVRAHAASGGLAAVYEAGKLVLCDGPMRIELCRADDVPLSMDGKAFFNIQNCLAAMLAGYTQGVDVGVIRSALLTFYPSIEQSPGRLTQLTVKGCPVYIDYAHNTGAFAALADYIRRIDGARKIGIIGTAGDRRDQDLREIGRLAAGMYTDIIIREDRNLRGRPSGETPGLIRDGVLESGFPTSRLQWILNEREATERGLEMLQKGDVLVIHSDKIQEVLDQVRAYKDAVEPVAAP
jgi:cyanophycin synthetase